MIGMSGVYRADATPSPSPRAYPRGLAIGTRDRATMVSGEGTQKAMNERVDQQAPRPESTGSPAGARVLLNASNLHHGGGVVVAASVINELSRSMPDAHRVTVLASDEVASNLANLGTVSRAFGEYRVFNTYGPSTLRTRKPVDPRDFDVMLTIFGPSYWPVRRVKKVTGFAQPWIAYPDNALFLSLPLRQRVRSRAIYEVMAAFFLDSDVLFVEHDHVKAALRSRHGFRHKAIQVVPNVVDPLHFDASRWQRVEIPPRGQALRLGVASKNYPHKNLTILPQVKSRLAVDYGINAEFFVTLSADAYQATSTEFRSSVHNVGQLLMDQCPSFTSQLDAVVFPTLLECYSATPIEALAVRTPVFTSDLPFMRQILHEHARYFDPLDAASIAASIHSYFALPESQRAQAQEAGFEFVASSTYTAEQRARSIMSIVEDVATGVLEPDTRD